MLCVWRVLLAAFIDCCFQSFVPAFSLRHYCAIALMMVCFIFYLPFCSAWSLARCLCSRFVVCSMFCLPHDRLWRALFVLCRFRGVLKAEWLSLGTGSIE